MTSASTRSVRLTLLGAAIATATAVLLTLALSSAAQEPVARAPTFKLPDVRTSAPVSLDSFRGQTVLLVFCAAWVPACKQALPTAQAFASRNVDKVRIVGVSLDNPEFRSADVAAFAGDLGLNIPFVRDGGRRLAKAFNIRRLPATYVIGPDGSLKGAIGGFSERYEDDLRRNVPGSVTARPDAGNR